MKKFLHSKAVKELCEITANMYRLGWDERNGGNISVMIDEAEVRRYLKKDKILRDIEIPFTADEVLRGKYFLVTGTGKYFKNVIKDSEANLGLIKIGANGHTVHLLWGYQDGGKMTSEFPAHLMSHAVRFKLNPHNRVIMHTHPTYTMAMGACVEADSATLTRKLWKTNTEAVVIFPEGVGVLPCMVCGTNEIGEATAEMMKKHRLVSWTNHGIYGAGNDLDEAFGLIETVEKTAQVYMLSLGHVVNEIPDEIVIGLADLWGLEMMPGVLKEKK
ncbi:MAG: rhamnulose-1-phosphate aldolase [Bacilli bacterium]|jgi:rhamnulose-1-phosphate aldolase